MPIFNHFGISNLYFSTENQKSVHFFYAHNCVVFMDGLNLVAWILNLEAPGSIPAWDELFDSTFPPVTFGAVNCPWN